jgi:hypothetical protein
MMNRKAFWALVTAGMTVISTVVVSAQSIVPSFGMLGEFRTKSLIGSWQETFTFVGGPQDGRIGKGLGNYNDDGTLIGSEGGTITFDPDPQKASVSSDDVGAWKQTEWNTFVYTSYSLFSDFNGNVVGSLKVRGTYKLGPSGDTYSGYSYYEGTITGVPPFSGFVINKGVRTRVEPPPPFPSPTP